MTRLRPRGQLPAGVWRDPLHPSTLAGGWPRGARRDVGRREWRRTSPRAWRPGAGREVLGRSLNHSPARGKTGRREGRALLTPHQQTQTHPRCCAGRCPSAFVIRNPFTLANSACSEKHTQGTSVSGVTHTGWQTRSPFHVRHGHVPRRPGITVAAPTSSVRICAKCRTCAPSPSPLGLPCEASTLTS